MGYYNVVSPCVVGKLHYARPTVQPIVVDDDTAAPLVESGCLEAYCPGKREALAVWTLKPPQDWSGVSDEPPKPRRSRSRSRAGDSDGGPDGEAD